MIKVRAVIKKKVRRIADKERSDSNSSFRSYTATVSEHVKLHIDRFIIFSVLD